MGLGAHSLSSSTASRATKSREGSGHEMVPRTLPYELEADTNISFTGDGLRFTMGVPLGPGVLAENGAE